MDTTSTPADVDPRKMYEELQGISAKGKLLLSVV
jgi:hypothetical protein